MTHTRRQTVPRRRANRGWTVEGSRCACKTCADHGPDNSSHIIAHTANSAQTICNDKCEEGNDKLDGDSPSLTVRAHSLCLVCGALVCCGECCTQQLPPLVSSKTTS
eukprot:GHVS01060950.1.p1 GENE.GHVS01060950.1~~GHVS01060950.1.p1  ORF type:complete len:107 (-),score=5.92 GHVS01060950.1:193-513(-)